MIASPPLAIVAGSGLDLARMLDDIDGIKTFSEFAGLPASEVAGHEGRFIVGRLAGRRVIIQSGRLHIYEGVPIETVQRPIDILAEFGAESIVLTNAAGGLDPQLTPGSLVAIERAFLWPCVRWPDAPAWLETDFSIAGCDDAGEYVWVHGPSYETPAEIAIMQKIGGKAVGMSTAPEIARCRELGIPVAAVSCITNQCGSDEALTHESVLDAAAGASKKLRSLLRHHLENE